MEHPLIEAGIDYLSLHTPMWSAERTSTIEEVIGAYQAFSGNFSPLAYKQLLGYAGYGDDHLFIGQREDGYIRRISGAASDHLFPLVFAFGDRPSRIDVQATVRLSIDVNEAIQTHKAEAAVANLALPESRQRLISEHSDSRGGMTVYIGSRNSDIFGRMYNKYAKTKEGFYENSIRYEVEAHNEHAHVWAAALYLAGPRRHRTCVSYVRDWFEGKGIATHITQPATRQVPPPIHRTAPTVQRTLDWLQKQVRPAVLRLLTEVDRNEVVRILGLDLPDDPDAKYTLDRKG
jgi:hypothetical protein